MSKTLNSLGLSVNQKKVKVSTTDDLINYRSFKIFDLLKNGEAKKDKDKVEQFVDHYLELLNNSGLSNIKDNGTPLLNRALFCPAIRNIDISKRTKLMSCYLDDEYLKNARAIHLEKIYKLFHKNDKQEFIKKLNSLSKKLIHNAFHYELLNFYRRNRIDSKSIEKRIEKLSKV